ncbi:trypsin-like peptidase domain-containing protein [Streptomyces sp. NPDC049040]|uniref:trypsin-like peptidase domain-containing protein n=1 Tax=Streptomyces sp. NPDC049040 TaxID=3365593 RepID=UPI00371A93B7
MTSAAWTRAVVVGGDGGRVGSGCAVAPGLVLTARHVVVRPGGDRPAQVSVRLIDGDGPAPAEIAWDGGPGLDAVLLRCDPRVLGQGFAPVSWGELTCDRPTTMPRCRAVGFPRVLVRDRVRDSEQVVGHVDPATGLLGDHLLLELLNPVPAQVSATSPWSGMSGAAVFCHRGLIGMVRAVPAGWQGDVLQVLPARRLLRAPGFATALADVTGSRPALVSADQGVVFDDTPEPRLSPSYLLSPRAEVVPFTGREREVALLTDWCHADRTVDVAVVHGPGGTGKTRLATEIARRLASDPSGGPARPFGAPWTAGFVSDRPVQQPPDYAMLAANMRPLLLVVDYAETRPDQVDRILDGLRTMRPPDQRVRVLLLARSLRGWWPGLRSAHQGTTLMGRGLSVELGPAEADFAGALAAFRQRVHRLRAPVALTAGPGAAAEPQAPEPASGQEHDLLGVHMAALARALREAPEASGNGGRPVEVLLAHEQRYWNRVMRTYGLEMMVAGQPELLRLLVAVQRLAGAATRREALGVITTAMAVHTRDHPAPEPLDAERSLRLELALTDLYPSPDGARWGAMGPDVLGAELIAVAHTDSEGSLIAHVLRSPQLSAEQVRHARATIDRVGQWHPGLLRAAAPPEIGGSGHAPVDSAPGVPDPWWWRSE